MHPPLYMPLPAMLVAPRLMLLIAIGLSRNSSRRPGFHSLLLQYRVVKDHPGAPGGEGRDQQAAELMQ